MELANELGTLPLLEDLSPDQLAWMADHGDVIELGAHEMVFREGDPADYMFIVLSGQMRIEAQRAGQRLEITYEPGAATGLLPYSRMKLFGGTATVLVDSRLFRMHREHLPHLVEIAPTLAERLVAVMTNRVRELSRRQQQQEKMMALGKLAAGLAHELNNPASAIQRDARGLTDRTEQLDRILESLCARGLSLDILKRATAMRGRLRDDSPNLSTLERSRREDELSDWLDSRGVTRSFELAETFVDGDVGVSDLEELIRGIPEGAEADLLNWIEWRLATEQALQNIREAAERISALVNSVKAYAYMDRSLARHETDVRAGIENTLTMLGHKLRAKSIHVDRRFSPDLPLINAVGGELNQVWTNLIDNAVDAMNDGGTLSITTRLAADRVLVEIQDDGPGIPEEVKSRIFEPFFTTKEVGEGTGLGLDIVGRIVSQHGGTIDVESEPGRTVFSVGLRSAPE